MRKCSPSRVWKSRVPLSVTTSCLIGAVCQAKAPPEAVSSKDIVVVGIVPLSTSPRFPGSSSMTPSSKCEFWSSPVQIRTHRILSLLLSCLLLLPRVTFGYPKWNNGNLVQHAPQAPPGFCRNDTEATDT